MARKTIKKNIRIEIDPACTRLDSEVDKINTCESIIADIKRHVDDIGFIDVIWDSENVCEFCGYEWEVNEDANDPDWEVGEPVCCVKAQEEYHQIRQEKREECR